jgi:SAM-dependent methyltransferase
VDDGSYIYVDPSIAVGWHEDVVLTAPGRPPRSVAVDQYLVMAERDAQALVAEGLALRAGDRLFERPDLADAVIWWPADDEADFIESQLPADLSAGRGIEYGCGTGRLLRPLLKRGLRMDGIDVAESSIRWLDNTWREQLPDVRLFVGDMSACAFPGAYSFAVAGLNTLRYLPTVAGLRRHLHMAALSVVAGGRYVAMVDSWTDDSGPEEIGSYSQWQGPESAGAQALTVRWSRHDTDPEHHLDLERIAVHRDQTPVHVEHHAQLALSLRRWGAMFAERGEWTVASIHLDRQSGPVAVTETDRGLHGNFWLVAERTGATAPAIFTR